MASDSTDSLTALTAEVTDSADSHLVTDSTDSHWGYKHMYLVLDLALVSAYE